MSELCEVVAIDRDGVKVTINASDKTNADTLWKDDPLAPKQGTDEWYKDELDKAEVDRSDAKNKAELKALFDKLTDSK